LLNRREFIIRAGLAGGAALASSVLPLRLFANNSRPKIVILHTNDVHSRIEPFPMDGGRHQGKAGFSPRAAIIEKIRNDEPNVLLFDAGDILQGTPYFNYFQGDIEFDLMSKMMYDATAIGNHDFDAGIENLSKLAKRASFPLICSNYETTGTVLENQVLPFKVFKKANINIGVYALGIELNGLVPEKLFEGVVYSDPLTAALYYENLLAKKYNCQLIICLSHLGYKYANKKISDVDIAKKTSFTDLIIGGHTHTFMDKPDCVLNAESDNCYVFQTGWGGINLGRVDFEFSGRRKGRIVIADSVSVS
jgi:5'-nucleotidase